MSQQTNTEPTTQRINAQFSRARTPYNKGFLFTVQPELKNIDKRNIMEKALGEERMKLYKKITSASRGKNTGLGKKLNPRWMNILGYNLPYCYMYTDWKGDFNMIDCIDDYIDDCIDADDCVWLDWL